MPKDKKRKAQQQPNQLQARGLSNQNSYFETAEELSNRYSGSQQQQRQKQKQNQAAPNPEQPEL